MSSLPFSVLPITIDTTGREKFPGFVSAAKALIIETPMRWLVLLSAGVLWGQKLPPIDDSFRNPEFQGFVRKLQGVVAKRDVKGLKKLLDDDVIAFSEGKKEEKGWAACADGQGPGGLRAGAAPAESLGAARPVRPEAGPLGGGGA
jgi:hypothetical protein